MLTSSSDGVPVLEPRSLVRRRFVMTMGVAVVVAIIALLAGRGSNDRIIGSGSTFAQPLIERTAIAFQNERSGDRDWISGSAGIDYEPVGSLGGVMRLQDPEVDFAVSDYPLSASAVRAYDAIQFPIAIGSLSPVYNLAGPAGRTLAFSPATLALIFGGRIKSWSDPAIAADNPGIALPETPITVIYRKDGSGSTLNFTTYLAQNAAGWRAGPGVGTTVRWPGGVGVKGSGGMAEAVAARDGAIGYLETGQARRAKLSIAALRNAAGRFVVPDKRNVAAGARAFDAGGGGAAGADATAYPLVTAAYVVMKRRNRTAGDNRRAARFLAFLLDRGGADARALGYLPVSSDVAAATRRIWAQELNLDSTDGARAGSQ